MKAFQVKDDEKRIYFKNYERIPAEQELDILIRELTVAGFQIGQKKSAGLEDFYECKKDYVRFDIVVTDEEAFIYSSNKEAINILMEIFK